MKSTRAIAVLIGLTLGVTATPIMSTSATAAVNPCRLPGGVLKTSDLGERSAVGCDAVGRLVDVGNGVSLPVQPPGGSVTLHLSYVTGSRSYSLTTDAQGLVTTSRGPGKPTQEIPFPERPGPGPCERESYALRDYKWYWPWLFRATEGTALGTEGQSTFDAALRRAVANITGARNNCGLRDQVSATGALIGRTTRQGNFDYVGDQTTCTASDSRSVIDEGDLPGGFLTATLAATCIWTETHAGLTMAVSADIRLNDGDYDWTYNPLAPTCEAEWLYDVESVLTHEIGHVYGLADLSEVEDINQTMFPTIRRCSGNVRTLGRGDVFGLRALY